MTKCNKIKTSIYIDEDLLVELNEKRRIEERTLTSILNKALRLGLHMERHRIANRYDELETIIKMEKFNEPT